MNKEFTEWYEKELPNATTTMDIAWKAYLFGMDQKRQEDKEDKEAEVNHE